MKLTLPLLLVSMLFVHTTMGAEAEYPPLHQAVHRDELVKVQTLLAEGADARLANRYGVTPLALACENGHIEIINALLVAGADPNATLRGGETALMTAARTGRVAPLQALLKKGAMVNATDRKGQTALMWAAADGHAPAVQALLEAGADLHYRLPSGFTALLFAARNGHRDVVRTLIKAGGSAHEAIETTKGGGRAPGHGTSALLLAVENGHFELALDLISAGADPNDMRNGFTPLHTLTWVRKPDRGDDLSGQPPPEGSGAVSSLDFVKKIVACGADVNQPLRHGESGRGKLSFNGATPLFLAAKTADLPLVKLLVALGADPLAPNADGATPLMAAAGLGCHAPDEEAGTEAECLATVEYLLTRGADLNITDRQGETAMHGAAYKSLPKMVHFLTEHGAKPALWNQKNKARWSPIMIAEGFRPGNFKPSIETLEALHQVLQAAGITPPPPTPRKQ